MNSRIQKKEDFFSKAKNFDFHEYANSISNYPDDWEKLEEICAKYILQAVLSGYEISYLDTGEKNNQPDLLARNGNHQIAIEVTQATNPNAISTAKSLNENNFFIVNTLNYEWTININITATCKMFKKDK